MAKANPAAEPLIGVFREAIVALVRRDGADLSSRQLAVFLTCYLDDRPQTVRGLAEALGISKPAVTRAIDRLIVFDLCRRKPDPADRRSVLVQRTPRGGAFLREMRAVLARAAARGAKESRTA